MTHTHARMHVILQSMLAAKSFSPERTEEGVAGYIAILAFEIATRACASPVFAVVACVSRVTWQGMLR